MKTEAQVSSFKFQVSTNSSEETQVLGEKIGAISGAGTVIGLTGDLGSGKTVLVQGLARGLAVPGDYYITSPSYTLINEYPGRLPLFHVDLYRIGTIEEVEDIGLLDIVHKENVVAIEWADRLQQDLLSDHLTIHFDILNATSRKIDFMSYGQNSVNLLKKLNKHMK
jgi:tRNA threonylcarbamoyladenosine biosynthesis protein TsaE